MTCDFQRLKVVRGHAGMARFCAELGRDLGYIPRQDIPSPYAYSPTHIVSDWQGQPVIVVETAHRRHEVFLVPPYTKIYRRDKDATDVYISERYPTSAT